MELLRNPGHISQAAEGWEVGRLPAGQRSSRQNPVQQNHSKVLKFGGREAKRAGSQQQDSTQNNAVISNAPRPRKLQPEWLEGGK